MNDTEHAESVYQEMFDLDPLRAHAKFSKNECVKLSRLCEINSIENEFDVQNELKALSLEFMEHQSRENHKSVFSDNSITDEPDDDSNAPLPMLIESEHDEEELTMDSSNLMSHKISIKNEKCSCFQCVLKYINANEDRKKKYKNVCIIYRYVLMPPCTQVKCERDFSGMKFVKTRLRSSLNDISLENLMILYTESNLFNHISLDEIVDEYIATSPQVSLFIEK